MQHEATTLPVLGPASFASKATKFGAFVACGALLAMHSATLYSQRGEIEVRHLLLLALAPFLADVLSGLVHWAADTWGSETTPILGPRFIRPFRVHHLNGADILSRPFLDLNGDVALGVVPLLAAALPAPAPLRLFLVVLALCILPTNQIHQWAHSDRVPRLVRVMQRGRLILPQPDHQRHHTEPFRSHYCITTGWMNPFFEKTGILVRIERLVRRHCPGGTNMPARCDTIPLVRLTYPLSDLALSRRLESCEGKTNRAFVEARARLRPESGATWIECAGAYALFDGVGSPLTQTFCLGLFATPADADLDTLEHFFEERGAAVMHEVSPMAPAETLELLVARGYRPVELTSILFRPILLDALGEHDGRVRARIAAAEEVDLWSDTAAEGWREFGELSSFMRDIGRVSASSEGMTPFLAELDGHPVGTGAVAIHDGVAILAGASTIPEARKQGAQRALLEARLRHAAEHGCDLATMGAAPGSASQRNAERQGFRIAYTRIKWGR